MSMSELLILLLNIKVVVFLLFVYSKASNVDVLTCKGIAESISSTEIYYRPTFKNFDMAVDFSRVADAKCFLLLVGLSNIIDFHHKRQIMGQEGLNWNLQKRE